MDRCGLSSTGLQDLDANNITSDNLTIYSSFNVSGFSNLNELTVTPSQEFSPTAVGAVIVRHWGGYPETLGRLQSGNDSKTHCRPSQNLKYKTNWKESKEIKSN